MVASGDGHFDCDCCGEGGEESGVLTEVQRSGALHSPARGKADTSEWGWSRWVDLELLAPSGEASIWKRGAAYSWLGLKEVYLKELRREKWRKEAPQQGLGVTRLLILDIS